MLKTDVARQYRKKFPEKPTLGLARILYKENKKLYKDLDDARYNLRYIEGKAGDKNRKHVADKSMVLDAARPLNPYKLPESEAKDIPPYILKGFKRALIINDVHLQFHDIAAITTCFDYSKKEKPDVVLINGDLLDFHGLSFFLRDPRKKNFAHELELFKQFFEILQRVFKCKVIFKFGNHEKRYQNYLYQKAGELVGVDEFELSNIIKARAEGIEVVADNQIIQANELSILHGHEFGRGFFNPVNTARGLHLRAKVTALQGDSHKSSEHTETDLKGTIKTTWSVGALCGLKAEYAPYNTWNHGFAILDLDPNRVDFNVRNYRIYKGKVI